MKKLILAVFFIFIAAGIYCDPLKNSYLETKLGGMYPWGTGLGFRIGETYGYRIDQVVSLNGSLDFFRTSYSADVQDSNGNNITATSITNNTTANLLKLMLNIRIDIPYEIAEVLKFYGQCGLGYEVMINNYNTPAANQTFVFGDFGLELEIGANLRLGDRTKLILTTDYNFCSVGRSKSANETLIVGQKIDVSGFSFLTGIGFEW